MASEESESGTNRTAESWMFEAIKGINCEAHHCHADPVAERDGRNLCAKHRDHYDHSTSGRPCGRCGSRNWVRTPDAASVAVCAVCDYVTYDEGVLEGSW